MAALVLAGCASVGPDYQRPALDVPAHIAVTTQSSAEVDYAGWWKQFDDPVLNQLLAEALLKNQDMLLAAARVEEASALAVGARSARFPTVDASLSATKLRTSQNAGKIAPGTDPVSNDFQPALTASYEVDFWGKLARADEAAKARLLAQDANRAVIKSSLTSNLAQTYFGLRANDAALSLAQAIWQTRTENLRLQKKRYAAGSIGETDLHVSESELAAADISLAQAKQAVANSESALAVLLGRTPAEILKPEIARGKTIDQLYLRAELPPNLPSDLLNRRPDILAAEQSLKAANADVGQAKAQYFPSLKLTTGIGYEANSLRELINPASLLWNLGANLTQPVFRAGAIGALVSGAEARKAQATAQYVQAVQNAFRDVHDSLVNAEANQAVFDAGQRRVVALKDTLRLTELRYNNGYNSYLEVLGAQRDLAQTQFSLIDTQRTQLSAVVSLYKAVGGGWDQSASLIGQATN